VFLIFIWSCVRQIKQKEQMVRDEMVDGG